MANLKDPNDVFIKWLDKYIDDKLDRMFTNVLEPAITAAVVESVEKAMRQLNRKKPTHVAMTATRRTHLNSFGYESYDHMLMPYLIEVIKSANDFNAILQQVIVALYFNPEAKHNHNVYIPLNTYKCINVYMRGGWQSRVLNSTLMKMVLRANDVLQHYMVGSDEIDIEQESLFKQELGKKKYDSLRDFTNRLDNLEKYPELQSKLLHQTEHTIITTQHLIHPITSAATPSTS